MKKERLASFAWICWYTRYKWRLLRTFSDRLLVPALSVAERFSVQRIWRPVRTLVKQRVPRDVKSVPLLFLSVAKMGLLEKRIEMELKFFQPFSSEKNCQRICRKKETNGSWIRIYNIILPRKNNCLLSAEGKSAYHSESHKRDAREFIHFFFFSCVFPPYPRTTQLIPIVRS